MDRHLRIHHSSIQLLGGDCLERLRGLESESVDLIMTSPPYANQRQHTYGGIPADEYIEWFLPRAQELQRVLKPTGTFILNIREHVDQGERHPYVLQLILALKAQGWRWTEEYIWHKKNPMPGKWPNRFKNAWERLLQFNKQRRFQMYQKAVGLIFSTDGGSTPRMSYTWQWNRGIRVTVLSFRRRYRPGLFGSLPSPVTWCWIRSWVAVPLVWPHWHWGGIPSGLMRSQIIWH